MSRIKFYNVYDTMSGELVMNNATAMEIESHIGLSRGNISIYAKNYSLYDGRFRFKETGEIDTTMSLVMADWDRTVSMFKNVKWVKYGGKKLYINATAADNDEEDD